MNAREEERQLRATIEALTGAKPREGVTLQHLRRRLAMLTKPQPIKGLIPGHVKDERISLLLDNQRAALIKAMCSATSMTPADMLVRAFDEYAVRCGYGSFIERAKKAGR